MKTTPSQVLLVELFILDIGQMPIALVPSDLSCEVRTILQLLDSLCVLIEQVATLNKALMAQLHEVVVIID